MGHVEWVILSVLTIVFQEIAYILEIVASGTKVTTDDSAFDDICDIVHIVCLDIALALWVDLRHGVERIGEDAILG